MKTYQAVFNELTTEGVFGISLVENPAMEGLFVALSEDEKLVKHEIKLNEIDKEQRILMGLVLEPNKPVYRNQNGEEFNIVFNEDTIKNLSYHFFKANNQKNSTIEHEDKIEGVTFVESWIVEDSKIDKSAIHGFNYPVGSWVATMKVDSDEVWNDYVKTGKVQGFSVDAMLELKEVNLKSDINMSINEKILALLRKVDARVGGVPAEIETEVVEVKMGSVKTADGAMSFEYEGEELVAGIAVWAMAEDGAKVPIPIGEYALEGDIVLVVEEEGIIATVGEAKVEEAEETPMSEGADSAAPNPLADLADIKSIMIKYQEENSKAQELAFQEMKDAIALIKKDVVELSEQPADTPKRVIEQVALNAKGRILNKMRK